MMRPFILDCDTGRDDALAILYALKRGLPMEAAIASYGNTTLKNVVDNSLRIIALGNGKIPVFVGEEHPLDFHPLYERMILPRQEQAGNGLCNVLLPDTGMSDSVFVTAKERAAWVIEKSRQVGPIDYYITGPATNFASMLSYLPEGAIRRVVMMAGRLGEEWDKTPIPDFNIACDPFAFQKLLESSFEVVLVPVNTTYLIRLSLDEVNKLKASNDVALFLKELMVAHCRYFSPEPVFYFHDPSVLFVQEFPSCLHPTKIAFDNDPESPSFGKITKMREGKEGYSVCVFTPNEGERSDILAKILSTVGLSH